MGAMENQLDILSDSLNQKLQVLDRIQKCNERQMNAFSGGEADLEAFDREFDEKDQLIDEITRLDDGFEVLYDGIAQELKTKREQYAGQIKTLQGKIAKVTELSVSIQAQEARNKKLVEDYFAKTRNGIRQNRQSSKAAYDYYKSMSGMAYSTSRVMDDKK